MSASNETDALTVEQRTACEICGIRRLAGFNAPAVKRMHAEEGHGVPEAIRSHIRVVRAIAFRVGWMDGGSLERAADAIVEAYLALAGRACA